MYLHRLLLLPERINSGENAGHKATHVGRDRRWPRAESKTRGQGKASDSQVLDVTQIPTGERNISGGSPASCRASGNTCFAAGQFRDPVL